MSIKTEPEITQVLELVENNFKNNDYTYVQCLKEKIIIMYEQIGNCNKEIEAVKENQMEILEQKITTSIININLKGFRVKNSKIII